MDQQIFEGRRIAVQYAYKTEAEALARTTTPRMQSPPSKTIFIGNLSFEMSDQDLNDLFRDVQNVIDVRVAIDRRSGQPRGFAHADFPDVESASAAMRQLTDKVVYGRRLRVDYSGRSSERRTLT